MYFSTFILVTIVTVGVIALGASLVARALSALVRSLLKMRLVWVVSRPDSSLSGEFMEADHLTSNRQASFCLVASLMARSSGLRSTSAKPLPVPGNS